MKKIPYSLKSIFIGLGEVIVRREATNNTHIASIDSIIIVLPNFVAISVLFAFHFLVFFCFICLLAKLINIISGIRSIVVIIEIVRYL